MIIYIYIYILSPAAFSTRNIGIHLYRLLTYVLPVCDVVADRAAADAVAGNGKMAFAAFGGHCLPRIPIRSRKSLPAPRLRTAMVTRVAVVDCMRLQSWYNRHLPRRNTLRECSSCCNHSRIPRRQRRPLHQNIVGGVHCNFRNSECQFPLVVLELIENNKQTVEISISEH